MRLFPIFSFTFFNLLVGITSLLLLLFIISIQQRQWFPQMWNQILLHTTAAHHHETETQNSHFEACIIWFPTSFLITSPVYFCLFPGPYFMIHALTYLRLRVFAVAIPISSRSSQDWFLTSLESLSQRPSFVHAVFVRLYSYFLHFTYQCVSMSTYLLTLSLTRTFHEERDPAIQVTIIFPCLE